MEQNFILFLLRHRVQLFSLAFDLFGCGLLDIIRGLEPIVDYFLCIAKDVV
jgi:hypothetical protein